MYSAADRSRIAADHRARAQDKRNKAKRYLPSDHEYTVLMQEVGFHTIQAELWEK